MRSPAFITHKSREGAVAVLQICGELDMATATQLERAGEQVLSVTPAAPQLYLNLAEVSFCDATGLAAIVRLRHHAHRRGVRMRLVEVPHRLQRLFTIAGVCSVLIDDTASPDATHPPPDP